MGGINLVSLFGKLNTVAYDTVQAAFYHCKRLGHANVELLHWFHQILQAPDSDVLRIAGHYGLNPARLAKELTERLESLPRAHTAVCDFSPHILTAIERAWTYSTLLFGETQIRTGHLLIGILKTDELRFILLRHISAEFGRIPLDELTESFRSLLGQCVENGLGPRDGSRLQPSGQESATASPEGAMAAARKAEALDRYTVDLTAKAAAGELDPIHGRDAEIRQVISILLRRRQNNPILTGEAGVGKTAVVEGFAQRVADGDVPPALRDVSVRSLDLGLLQAGAGVKGEFENRLKTLIEEVQASPKPIILFIDEAHTLIGAGGAAGQGDAANLLKPALARGTLRTIAATTWAEYKRYVEKDPALTRRFQVVKVDEPSEEATVFMIRGLIPQLEKHHKVHILEEALDAAARLSHRYIPSRQLPDKAVSLLDTACARVAVSQHAIPALLEESTRLIDRYGTELRQLQREMNIGIDHEERFSALEGRNAAEAERREQLTATWEKERDLVTRLLKIRNQLRGDDESDSAAANGSTPSAATSTQSAPPSAGSSPAHHSTSPSTSDATSTAVATAELANPEEMRAELRAIEEELTALQGESALIYPAVDEQAVASVVADWTGVPVGKMVKNEIQAVLGLTDTLEKRIIGQRHALEAIARRIQTSRAGLDNPGKPIGVFMLAGTSGVGKTETALALAETLYGGEHNVITINMSEFQEAHTVSTLKGSPPGYVGYGEGGILTEAVRRKPYSVVLLDEVEKAHTDVHEIFFQVFDKGWMEDAEGRHINFRNTIILLTTNAGSDLLQSLCKDPDLAPAPDALAKALRPELLKIFPAALLGRLVVIPYFPLSDEMLRSIITLQLTRIQKRVKASQDVDLSWEPAAVELIASRCTEVESGGRMVDAILTQTLLPEMSRVFLERALAGTPVKSVSIGVQDSAFTYQY